MAKRKREAKPTEKRAAPEKQVPELDRAGGLTWEEQRPERGGETGGRREIERHDRTRDRKLDEPSR
jgi:hypothetical protein